LVNTILSHSRGILPRLHGIVSTQMVLNTMKLVKYPDPISIRNDEILIIETQMA
jgi:hypothetical protein